MEQKKKMPIWVKIVLAVGAIVIGVNLLRAAALMPAFYRYMSKNNPVIIQNYHKCRHFADMFRSYQMGQDRKKEVYGYEIDDLYLYNGSFSDFFENIRIFMMKLQMTIIISKIVNLIRMRLTRILYIK